MKERRSSERSAIELAASFGIGEDPRPAREAKIDNISGSGFCFISQEKLKIGEELQVVVDLDLVDQVIISVRIVWVEKLIESPHYRIGVEIIETDGPDFEKFAEFYKQQS